MQKRIIRPGVLGSPGFRPGGRRPGVRRPGVRRPGAVRPRPLAKIPTKMAELGFKAGRPGIGQPTLRLPKDDAAAKNALKKMYEMQLKNIGEMKLANRNPNGRRPGGGGMGLGAMLGRLDRVPGGMSPGPMGRPTGMRPGRTDMADRVSLTDRLRGGTGATGGRPPQTGGNPFAGQQNLRGMFAEGGEVLKTPIDKLPNKGLKKLAKSPKGRKAVARMGFKDGGIAKGGKCPSRGTIRGTGAAIRGVGFKGIK